MVCKTPTHLQHVLAAVQASNRFLNGLFLGPNSLSETRGGTAQGVPHVVGQDSGQGLKVCDNEDYSGRGLSRV